MKFSGHLIFNTRLVDLRDGCVPVCGVNVNSKTLPSPDRSVYQRMRGIGRMSSDRVASVILTSWGWQGAKIRKESLFLCFPPWAKGQMADLTAVYLTELSLWSKPSCQVGSSCVCECGSLLGRDFRPLEVWSPHASNLGNPHDH